MPRRPSIWILLAALSAFAPAAGADLAWPLEQSPAERRLSSSFGEDRGSHLHGGVDLSTGGRIGLPVVAVRDGSIYRVKVKWRGLGRAVYVQHEGDLVTVYGHLAGFAEPLRGWVDGEFGTRGRYPGDLWPDEPIPVRRGQVIAWSGKTGGGPPHLHFETREGGGNRPVDPFARGLPCPDVEAPRVLSIAFLPLHGDGPAVVADLPTKEPVPLSGRWRALARIEDPMGAGTGGVRLLEARVGDRLLLRADADGFTYDVTRYTGFRHARAAPTERDADACSGCWFWLAHVPGSRLPHAHGLPDLDLAELGEVGDVVALQVRARDGCGNETRVELPLRIGPPAAESRVAAPTVSPESGGRIERAEGRLVVPGGAVGEPVRLTAGGLPSLARRELPAELRLLGAIAPGPAWLPLGRKAVVSFALPEGGAGEPLGVYRWSPRWRAWQFWGDDVVRDGRLGTTTDRLGAFALLEDLRAPRVTETRRRPVRGRPWRADADELVVRYDEVGEGLAWDAIRLRPAGVDLELVAEHDPDLREGAFILPEGLADGRVRGTVELTDRAGNRTSVPVDSAPARPR